MAYLSNLERFAIERGLKQGLEQGLLQGMQQGVQQGVKQGMQQGTLIGLEKGRVEGESALLLRLLQHKFGFLNSMVQQRIGNADAETLLRWGEQVIDAKTIEEVFQE